MRELNVVELNVVNGAGDEVAQVVSETAKAASGWLSWLPTPRQGLTGVAAVAAVALLGYAAYYGYNQYYGSNEAV